VLNVEEKKKRKRGEWQKNWHVSKENAGRERKEFFLRPDIA